MDQKEMMERLKANPAALQALINSPDGQALMRMLQGNDGGARLQQATNQAAGGNTVQMMQLLKGVLSAPGGAELLRRIGQNLQK